MINTVSGATRSPAGREHRVAPRPRRRVGVLLAGMALVVGCGVAVVDHLGSSPVVRTVTVGRDPEYSLTIDDQTHRAFVFNRTDNAVSVLDTETGALLRTVSVGASYAWLAVDRPTGHVFLSSYYGTISMLDGQSGTVLRTVTDTDSDTRQIVVDERTNHVFVGHRKSRTVTVLDGRTGAIVRHLTVCGGPFAIALSERTNHLLAKCNDETTDVLDARTGQVQHSNGTNSGQYCGIGIDERTDRALETGNSSADLLDLRTGRIMRSWPTTTFCTAIAIDARHGWIYTIFGPSGNLPAGRTASEDKVAVLDGWTGKVLHRFPVPTNPYSLAIDSQTGWVLVGSVGALDSNGVPTTDGTVSVLDGTTGRLVRALQVGFTPSDIAIDAQQRRALIVSSYSDANGNGSLKMWRPRESWWPQVLRRVKQVICCLPFQAPAPPAPTTNGTVTTLDLARL